MIEKLDGSIRLWKSLVHHPVWLGEKFNRAQAWVDLLLLANDRDREFRVRGAKVQVYRGQVGWSLAALADRWKWCPRKVDGFLKELADDGMVEVAKGNVTSVITVVNYGLYQEGQGNGGQGNEEERGQGPGVRGRGEVIADVLANVRAEVIAEVLANVSAEVRADVMANLSAEVRANVIRKGEEGRRGSRKGEGLEGELPPPADGPGGGGNGTGGLIPSEAEVVKFCADWGGDLARGIPAKIPEGWALGWYNHQTRPGAGPWRADWGEALVRSFVADWVNGHPKARGVLGGSKNGAGRPEWRVREEAKAAWAEHPANPASTAYVGEGNLTEALREEGERLSAAAGEA